MKTLVFDFDGTIANTLESVVKIYNDTSPRFGCREINRSDLDRLRNGRPQDFMQEFGVSYLKLPFLAWMIRKKMKKDVANLPLQNGIKDTLRGLREKNIRLGILTSNSKENVEEFLQANDLGDVFAFVISHHSLFGKSGPLQQLKTDNEDILYIGDEVRDIEAARKAGVPSVGVSWGFQTEYALKKASPDYLFNEPEELLKLI